MGVVPVWAKKTIMGSIGTTIVGLMAVMTGAAPANAADRPVNVAFVQAWHFDVLHHGGSVTAKVGVRCKPGWESAELDVRINQGDSYADGFTTTAFACDNHWHGAAFRIATGVGSLRPGAVTVSSQFLVTNVESGDSAGGHDVGRSACLRHPGGSC